MDNNVIPLRRYTDSKDIQHVTFDRQEVEQLFNCPVCGDLQVVSGIVFHTKPNEYHEEGYFSK